MQIIIPYKKDCNTRQYNLIKNLKKVINVYEVILVAQMNDKNDQMEELNEAIGKFKPKKALRVEFRYFPDNLFNKNRLINIGLEHSTSNQITVLDCDCYLNMRAIQNANKILRASADKKDDNPFTKPDPKTLVHFIFPHNKLMLDVLPNNIEDILYEDCIGGAICFNKDVFIDFCGAENERFISWGFEDGERFERIIKLGFQMINLGYPIYHLHHERGIDSSDSNPFLAQNRAEFYKVKEMTADEIKIYAEELKSEYYTKHPIVLKKV